MKCNKDISHIARELSYLDINPKGRKRLIEANYSCFGIHLEFPQELERVVKEAKKNNLRQNEAYEYLKENTKRYDDKLASGMASQGSYTFGINGQ